MAFHGEVIIHLVEVIIHLKLYTAMLCATSTLILNHAISFDLPSQCVKYFTCITYFTVWPLGGCKSTMGTIVKKS